MYKKEVNVKIQGTGVGGCDILLTSGASDSSDCWCLWGTLNYSFCAFVTKIGESSLNETMVVNDVGKGRCPIVTGESLQCSDLDSLGNCYNNHGYECVIESSGLCSCKAV